MNPIIEGAIVTHVFYVNLVGEVLRIDDRFGVLVQWKSEDRKMAHMCRQPQRHPIRLLALADEWRSIPQISEGLNCMREEASENEIAPVTEDESDDAEPQVEAPIEESANSEPLPEAEEDFSNYEDEERLDLSHLIG